MTPNTQTASRVLHESKHYTACLTRAGLIVQTKRQGTGVLLPKTHAQYPGYVDCFDDLMDKDEGDDLCRALLRSA